MRIGSIAGGALGYGVSRRFYYALTSWTGGKLEISKQEPTADRHSIAIFEWPLRLSGELLVRFDQAVGFLD